MKKKYENQKVGDMDFKVCEQVFLKLSPIKGIMRFGKDRLLIYRSL